MKKKYVRNRKTKRRELVISLKRNESVSSRKLRWLDACGRVILLHCKRDSARRKLRYDVDGLTSLGGFVTRNELTVDALANMLVGISEVLALCTSVGIPYFYVLLDPAHVLMTARGELRFVFVPLGSAATLIENTQLTLLGLICDSQKARFATPEAAELSRRIADFVVLQEEEFSSNALRRFVHAECGVDVSADGVASWPDANPERALCDAEAGWRLRRVSTDEAHPLPEGRVARLGRGAECAIRVLNSEGVSRVHACVQREGDEVLLWDVGSTNGTTVSGRRLQTDERVHLQSGESFSLASERFVVEGP